MKKITHKPRKKPYYHVITKMAERLSLEHPDHYLAIDWETGVIINEKSYDKLVERVKRKVGAEQKFSSLIFVGPRKNQKPFIGTVTPRQVVSEWKARQGRKGNKSRTAAFDFATFTECL